MVNRFKILTSLKKNQRFRTIFFIPFSLLSLLILSSGGLIIPSYASPEKPTAAILTLEVSGGIPESYAPAFSDRLRLEVFKTDAFQVMERNEMTEILKEIGFQMTGCTSNECVIEAGRILGVEQMIAGSISQIGEIFTISLRVIDVQTAEILQVENVDYMGSIEELLTMRLKEAAMKLAGKSDESLLSSGNIIGKGNVRVTSLPAGAKVYIDGKLEEKKTPAVINELSAGLHIIRLEKEGLVGAKQVFILPGVTSEIEVSIKPGFGSLSVESSPTGGEILVDGKKLGLSPVKLDTFPSGEHNLTVSRPGYETYQEKIQVVLNQMSHIKAELKELSKLYCISAPQGVKVKLDGKIQGKTPLTINNIIQGKHQVSYHLPGYVSYSTEVNTVSGHMDSVKYALQPRKKSTGTLLSAFIPGTGQIHSGKTLKGWSILTAQLLAGYFAYDYIEKHRSKVDEYNAARQNYLEAVYFQDIQDARQEMITLHSETQDLYSIRNGLIAAATLIYMYNLFDIAFINTYPQGEPWKGFYFSAGNDHQTAEIGFKLEF